MRKLLLVVSVAAIALTVVPSDARTSDLKPGVRPLDLPIKLGRINPTFGVTRETANWAGYNLGYLGEAKKQLFSQVSGVWIVPTPSKHTNGVDEYSVNWVGIGGGCVSKNCLVTDATLIQAGTGQYIDRAGNRRYFAWWEIIPGPILEITNFPVHAGDIVFAEVKQIVAFSDLWRVTVKNLTTGQTFNQVIVYASTRLTAEWIEERPSVGGFPAPLPNLTNPRFNASRVNDQPTNLDPSSAIVMSDFGSVRYATPSNPDPDRDGFNVCTWTTSCGAPSTP